MQKRRDYMIFDAHCDIWTHVARKRLEGERDIMRKDVYKRQDIYQMFKGIIKIYHLLNKQEV